MTSSIAVKIGVEAARAGEHGKGFAVVASEVRKLAERSQTAAGEINELSSSSVVVAEKAGSMLNELVPNIQRTSDLIQEITAATNEQNTGAEQINKSLQLLDNIIQQNASASEQMASTSQELSAQAKMLDETISFFSIKEGGASVKRVQPVSTTPAKKVTPKPAPPEPKPAAPVRAEKQIPASSTADRGVDLLLDDSGGADSDDSEFEKY